MAGTRKNDTENKKTKKPVIIVILLVVIAALATLLIINSFSSVLEEDTLERELAAEMGILPGMSDEEIESRLNHKVAESMMNVGMNPHPKFEDGKSEGNVMIENVPGNNYAFTVTITRMDNGEEILKTGVLDPGYYIERIKLDKDLPKGEYACVATFTGYDPETLTEIGETGMHLLITVNS